MSIEKSQSDKDSMRSDLDTRVARFETAMIAALGEEGFEHMMFIARNTDDKPISELLTSDEINRHEEVVTARAPTNVFRAAVELCRAKLKFSLGNYPQSAECLNRATLYLGSASAHHLNDKIISESRKHTGQKKHDKNAPIQDHLISLLVKNETDGGLKPAEGWGIESQVANLLAPSIEEFIKTHNKMNPDNKFDLTVSNVKRLITDWIKKPDTEIRKVYLENVSEKASLRIGNRESRRTPRPSSC